MIDDIRTSKARFWRTDRKYETFGGNVKDTYTRGNIAPDALTENEKRIVAHGLCLPLDESFLICPPSAFTRREFCNQLPAR